MKLKELRTKQNITLAEIAKKMGCSRQNVFRVEKLGESLICDSVLEYLKAIGYKVEIKFKKC